MSWFSGDMPVGHPGGEFSFDLSPRAVSKTSLQKAGRRNYCGSPVQGRACYLRDADGDAGPGSATGNDPLAVGDFSPGAGPGPVESLQEARLTSATAQKAGFFWDVRA